MTSSLRFFIEVHFHLSKRRRVHTLLHLVSGGLPCFQISSGIQSTLAALPFCNCAVASIATAMVGS